jgi:hypothetical protein
VIHAASGDELGAPERAEGRRRETPRSRAPAGDLALEGGEGGLHLAPDAGRDDEAERNRRQAMDSIGAPDACSALAGSGDVMLGDEEPARHLLLGRPASVRFDGCDDVGSGAAAPLSVADLNARRQRASASAASSRSSHVGYAATSDQIAHTSWGVALRVFSQTSE